MFWDLLVFLLAGGGPKPRCGCRALGWAGVAGRLCDVGEPKVVGLLTVVEQT